MNCNFDCNQGRDCQCRQACELPLEEDQPERDLAEAVVLWACAVAFCAVLASVVVG